LAVLALFAAPMAAAQVPDPFARDLAQRLTRAELILAQDGYMRAAGPFSGGLPIRETRSITLTLRAGQEYGVVGVCDGRCGFALQLHDPNGAPVARGVAMDGASVMHVRPAFTGPYDVQIHITRCAAAECWYAVNVYSR
jgi:hypothetical protein